MKFRNLETREVFDNIHSARHKFCENKFCFNCPVPNWLRRELLPEDSSGCCEFCEYHPIEAAALMGYEAIEARKRLVEHQDEETGDLYYTVEKEANMDKPRICEVLGVEVNEEFTYTFGENQVNRGTFKIGEDGARYYKTGTGQWNLCYNEEDLLTFINRPDYIIRKPRFTQQDIEDAKMIRAVLGKNGFIKRYDNSDLAFNLVHINKNLFPSIKEGQEYSLDEIIRSGEQS